MNVLINCQSGADTRLIESVSSSANNFQCLEPYADFHLWPTTPHATSELLTINQSDDVAIHHLSLLVLFFSATVCGMERAALFGFCESALYRRGSFNAYEFVPVLRGKQMKG